MVRPGRDRLTGVVDVDESYWGGKEKGVIGRRTRDKALIIVAAVLIDIRNTCGSDKKLIPAGWVTKAAQYFAYYIDQRYQIPWYILTDDKILVNYPDNAQVSVFLSGDKQGTSIQFLSMKDSSGYPVAAPGAHVPYSDKWYFWW